MLLGTDVDDPFGEGVGVGGGEALEAGGMVGVGDGFGWGG